MTISFLTMMITHALAYTFTKTVPILESQASYMIDTILHSAKQQLMIFRNMFFPQQDVFIPVVLPWL